MPMGDTNKLYGTNADGSKNEDYCKYCFENGKYCAFFQAFPLLLLMMYFDAFSKTLHSYHHMFSSFTCLLQEIVRKAHSFRYGMDSTKNMKWCICIY